MNSTPPIAFFRISFVLGAVWPIYWPTRSSRVTEITCPRRTKPRPCRIFAMRNATVVLPVPGLPVNDMCSVGGDEASPARCRIRSISKSDAIWRTRFFTGFNPISSCSSCCSVPVIPAASASLRRSKLVSPGSVVIAWGTSSIGTSKKRASPRGSGEAVETEQGVLRAEENELGWRVCGLPAHGGVADRATAHLLPHQLELGFLRRAVDDERDPHRFPPMAGVEAAEADVSGAIHSAGFGELHHHAGGVLEIEHRQAPHLPIGVAGMRIVGELDVHGPTIGQAILHLLGDLVVGQIGQEREAALGQLHVKSPQTVSSAVGTKSGVSVDS